jgi:hypothetical protein
VVVPAVERSIEAPRTNQPEATSRSLAGGRLSMCGGSDAGKWASWFPVRFEGFAILSLVSLKCT